MDGLDEVSQKDGQLKLLRSIRDIGECSGVKLCLSSRPEQVFKQGFSSARCLQLHRLTAPDIRRFTVGNLRNLQKEAPFEYKSIERVARQIVEKAEGVFLWAFLAVKSLERGILYGDSTELLERRLEELPSELSELYADMLNRLGTDAPLYKQWAALCFNLVLPQDIDGYKCPYPGHESVLRMLLAHENQDIMGFLRNKSWLDPISLEEKCIKFDKMMGVRCAGLLERVHGQDMNLIGAYATGLVVLCTEQPANSLRAQLRAGLF